MQKGNVKDIVVDGAPFDAPSFPLWHTKEIEAVTSFFGASEETGLSDQAAQLNLQRYGPNTLPEPKRQWELGMFLSYFNSGPVALLTAAAGLSAATGGIADAAVINGRGSNQRLLRLCHRKPV